MSDTSPEWAGNPVPWNPELSDVVPSATPVPGADTWTVPFEDFTTPDNAFTAPDNPFALEMRAETIEQLVGGDSLRRGESECVEAGRSGTNADLVGGRDRVQAQGRLHEHTGRDFAAQAAHLEATVDGSLDVHAVRDDTVLHAGHMVEEWEGGTAVLAGIADDLVAGGGVRVTAPLDLWVHGLMGVEERIGTCTADAVLAEFAATHYEREYGSGVHRAAVAVLQGKLYQTTRSQFYPLMKVSTGVRNLVAGGGDGGGGSTPATSAPATPPPGEGGAPVEAASETLSIATDSARSVEGGVEGAVRMEDAANLRRIADAADAGTEADPRTYPPPVVTLERVDSESIRSTGSASSEGLVRPGWMDELFADADVLLADIGRSLEDPGATPGAEELSGLGHPAGSAEQLAALRRGEFATDVPVPGLDRSSSASPDVRTWEEMLDGLLHELTDHRLLALADTTDPADARVHQAAADTHQGAVDEIARKILWEFSRFGGEADDLHPAHTEAGKARTAYRILENKLIEAERANNVDLAAGIRRALQEIDQFTYTQIARLSDLPGVPGAPGRSAVPSARATSPVSEPGRMGYETVGPGTVEPYESGYAAVGGGSRRVASDSSSAVGVDADALRHLSPAPGPTPRPTVAVTHVADAHGTVRLSRDTFESIRRGEVVLNVVDADGHAIERGAHTIAVEGYDIAESSVLYRKVKRADEVHLSTSFLSDWSEGDAPLPPRTAQALEIVNPVSLQLPDSPGASGLSRTAGAGVDESLDWFVRYQEWMSRHREHGLQGNRGASLEHARAIAEIDARVWDVFEMFGGDSSRLDRPFFDLGDAAPRYRALEVMARAADDAGNLRRAGEIREALEAIDRRVFELSTHLAAHAGDALQDVPQSSTNAGAAPRGMYSPGDWRGGPPGSGSDPRRFSFGQGPVAETQPPGRQAGALPEFGRERAPPAADIPFSFRERTVQTLMNGEGLSEADMQALISRFATATEDGEVARYSREWYSMAAVLASAQIQSAPGGANWRHYGGVATFDWESFDALLRLYETPRTDRPV